MVGALWRNCALAAAFVAAAAAAVVAPQHSCAPAGRLSGRASCETADWPRPFFWPAELHCPSKLVPQRQTGVRFWEWTEWILQVHESWCNVGGGQHQHESSLGEKGPAASALLVSQPTSGVLKGL